MSKQLLKIYVWQTLFVYIPGTSSVDWSTLDLTDVKIEVAKIVVATMSEITGSSIDTIVENLNNSFYNVGGSSLNSIQVIVKLRQQNCYITIPDFVNSPTILGKG